MRRLSNTIVTRSSLALLAAGILAGCGGGSAAEPTALKGTVAGVPTTSPLAGIQDDRVWQVPAKEATPLDTRCSWTSWPSSRTICS